MLGALLSGATSLLGGFLGDRAAKKAQKWAAAREDTAIQRRVRDSVAAGVHPLFGLGASVTASNPVVAGNVGDSLREVGQDVGRAVDATKAAGEQGLTKAMQALQLKRMGLENTLIETQIASERHRLVGAPPAAPAAVGGSDMARSSGSIVKLPNGKEVKIPPATSADDVAGELGELSGDVYGALRTADGLARDTRGRESLGKFMEETAARWFQIATERDRGDIDKFWRWYYGSQSAGVKTDRERR